MYYVLSSKLKPDMQLLKTKMKIKKNLSAKFEGNTVKLICDNKNSTKFISTAVRSFSSKTILKLEAKIHFFMRFENNNVSITIFQSI